MEEANEEGFDYCGPVKTSHKGFFLTVLKKLTKECLGGSCIIMNSDPRAPGDKPLMAVG